MTISMILMVRAFSLTSHRCIGPVWISTDGVDVLASFNNPKPTPSVPKPTVQTPALSAPGPGSSTQKATVNEEEEEDFEASLVEGMESLLRQLAGDNPPGPMPGNTSTSTDPGISGDLARPGNRDSGGAGGLSADDEEKAFQRAIEMMLSKEGIDALGLHDDPDEDDLISDGGQSGSNLGQGKRGISSTSTSNPNKTKSEPSPTSSASKSKTQTQSSRPDPASFEETIRKAMESLNTAGDKKPRTSGEGGIPSDPAELAKLLASLGNDPNLDLDGDDELSGILDGMMGQLMTREVLEEPMSELASKVIIDSFYIKHPIHEHQSEVIHCYGF